MVTLALGGDVMLGRGVAEALAERPAAAVWDAGLLEVFAEADAAIVNLECCISERGQPWPDPAKPFFFRAPPSAVEALAAGGVKAVWLANNHALDFGSEALLDTFEHLRAGGIKWSGAGRTVAEARRGVAIEVGTVPVGLVAFADHPEDFAAAENTAGTAFADPGELERSGPPDWLVDEVRRLRGECQVVIVGPHWGPNMNLSPLPYHRAVARALVAAGATAIAGHSAHVPQGIGRMGGTAVCYDLGDLLDDYATDPDVRNDLGILALLTPGVRLELVPLRLEYARTRLAHGDDLRWLIDRLRWASRLEGVELRPEDGRLVLDLRAGAAVGG